MEDLGVVRAATNRFIQARGRFLGFVPSSGAHPSFPRTGGIAWGDARGRVVGGEGFVESMRDLEGVPELDPWHRLVRHPPREVVDLAFRRVEIAREREDANE